MKKEVVKAIIHLTDEKGWTHTVHEAGNYAHEDMYNVSSGGKTYSFSFEKYRYENMSLNYFVKHLYYSIL